MYRYVCMCVCMVPYVVRKWDAAVEKKNLEQGPLLTGVRLLVTVAPV